MPNPALTAWNKAEKLRKKQGLPVQQREPKPPKTDVYPTKIEIALTLLDSTLYIFMAWWPAYHLICSMLFDKFSNIHFLQDKC
jgi:hypothetical protein